ncbi:MAG: peptidoglycan recognition family protein [Lachnospiraceae bacterium]|nr:N-acetylmuramoyl-L-alanine amidase [Cuneatibacter sp.]MDD6456942.1 peptidoglycan recognition family protein [Lachnospiraceae bacterium]
MDREDRARVFRQEEKGRRSHSVARPDEIRKRAEQERKKLSMPPQKQDLESGRSRRESERRDFDSDRYREEGTGNRREREQHRQEQRRREIRQHTIAAVLFLLVVIALVVMVMVMKETPSSAASDALRGESRPPIIQNETENESESESESETETEQETKSEFEIGNELLRSIQDKLPDWITQDFIPVNEYSRPGLALGKINNIVVHYVGNPGTTAEANLGYFKTLANTSVNTSGTKASSNFVVGLEGEVLQCMPIYEEAYCSNNRNSDTLSIEVCHPDAEGKFNSATYASVTRLCAYLCNELGLTENDLIRHYDVTGKQCPKYYVLHPEAWDQFKADVGSWLKSGDY